MEDDIIVVVDDKGASGSFTSLSAEAGLAAVATEAPKSSFLLTVEAVIVVVECFMLKSSVSMECMYVMCQVNDDDRSPRPLSPSLTL